jgi:hypothetical protein
MDSGGPQKVPCANEVLTYEVGNVQKIAGVVTDPNGDGLPGVKLALFRIEDDEEKFVGSSEGDYKGRFCFPGLPKGKYVLYIGQGDEPFSVFKCVNLSFTLLPKNNSASQNIKIRLEIGT